MILIVYMLLSIGICDLIKNKNESKSVTHFPPLLVGLLDQGVHLVLPLPEVQLVELLDDLTYFRLTQGVVG
jgi:hypothetical protein